MQRHRAAAIPPSDHRRTDSTELDVFDARRYFSGGIDAVGLSFTGAVTTKSLEVPLVAVHPFQEPPKASESHIREKKMCEQQPISPGRSRLTAFLNSLFQQTPSKKKKKKKKAKCSKDVGQQSYREKGGVESFSEKGGSFSCIMMRGRKEDGKREEKEEDSDESDSSSDLFELKSYDLGDFSCYRNTNASVAF